MLRSLISQLYQRHEKSRKHLDQLYSSSCEFGTIQPQRRWLVATLEAIIGESRNIEIVLDLLDECETREDLLSWLASVGPLAFNILLTSRPLEEIESSLNEWIPTAAVLPLQQDLVDEDIRTVVHRTLAKDLDSKQWEFLPDIRRKIEITLLKKANGM